ncbi:MAG: gamma-glutamyltransferase [Acidobacteriota bacterium]|nr:gamma-glutamyltransferase [Acidobacteriota bacterium]
MRKISIRLICLPVIMLLLQGSLAFASRSEPASAKHAMVVSQHILASEIGTDMMRKGGNAVDAAVAVGFALAVVYPEAGNLGGGGFMVIRLADGRSTAIDYREMAPEAATRDIYLDGKGEQIEGEGGSVLGYRSAGVPGTPAGFEYAFKKYGSGKITWRQVLEPARRLAQNGFVLSRRLAALFVEYKDSLNRYPDSRRIFLNGGKYFEQGDVLIQRDLAKTLERLQSSGSSDFYRGMTAKLIADDMARNKGLITLNDLKNYEVRERTPVTGTYRGNKIVSMPPPSSGGIVLIQVLNMLEPFDLDALGHNSAAKYHLLTETMRRAFADRAAYMGDPDFAEIPTEYLTSKAYALQRGSTIKEKQASESKNVREGQLTGKEGTETTHYTVVDPAGAVVTNTYTINNIYGSAVTAKGTGVLLNDEMDDFAVSPGKPNLFGLVQGEINAVGPRKRPLSSMTPTIVLKRDGTLWFALGARGGPRIISAVLQSTINMIDHGMNIQEALDAPRIHHQWLPNEIFWEKYGLSNDSRRILSSYGHVFSSGPRGIASATAIAVGSDGTKYGAIDSRSDGAAVGF